MSNPKSIPRLVEYLLFPGLDAGGGGAALLEDIVFAVTGGGENKSANLIA